MAAEVFLDVIYCAGELGQAGLAGFEADGDGLAFEEGIEADHLGLQFEAGMLF